MRTAGPHKIAPPTSLPAILALRSSASMTASPVGPPRARTPPAPPRHQLAEGTNDAGAAGFGGASRRESATMVDILAGLSPRREPRQVRAVVDALTRRAGDLGLDDRAVWL